MPNNLDKPTIKKDDLPCAHEFYPSLDGSTFECLHCGAKTKEPPRGSTIEELPSSISLETGGKKKPSGALPPHIQAEIAREKATKAAAAPKPVKIKQAKPIEIDVPINRFAIGWSEDDTKIVLRDEVYNNNEVMIDFQGASKKLDKPQKINLVKNIIDNIDTDEEEETDDKVSE